MCSIDMTNFLALWQQIIEAVTVGCWMSSWIIETMAKIAEYNSELCKWTMNMISIIIHHLDALFSQPTLFYMHIISYR